MKKIIMFIVLFMLILTGCSSSSIEPDIIVPDIEGLEESDLKSVLLNKGLLPKLKFEFSDSTPEDSIISINPDIGSVVKENDSVVVTYSRGPEIVYAKDATLLPHHFGYEEDNWKYTYPYINRKEKILYINMDVTLGTTVELNDIYDYGHGLARAIINDPYVKEVPVKIKYSYSKIINKGENTDLLVQIPLGDLDKNYPTDFNVYVSINYNGVPQEIILEFTSSWQ